MSITRKSINYHLFIVKVKGIISSLIFILFFVVAFSGIGLYFAPSGKEARLTNWTFFGLSKTTLESLHDFPGILFTILIFAHFLLNFKIYKNEIICLVRTGNRN